MVIKSLPYSMDNTWQFQLMNNINNSVCIIGAGWVGKILAQTLQSSSVDVLATASSDISMLELMALGIKVSQLTLSKEQDITHDHPVLQQQVLVVCIPPGIRYGKSDYPDKVAQLVKAAELPSSKVNSVILLSSTAVYNGLSGCVNEDSALNLQAQKVAIINQAEQLILRSNLSHKIVLRLGGLIGYNRQPGRFFKPEHEIANPDSVVNFIHRDDVVGIIIKLLAELSVDSREKPLANVYNCVASSHPKRQTFYTEAMQQLKAQPACFAKQTEAIGKQVDSLYISTLNYHFIHHDLMSWLKTQNEIS